MSVPDRRALVDRDHREPSIRKQCKLLGLSDQTAAAALAQMLGGL